MLKKRLSGSKFLLTLNAKLSTFSYLCGVESIKRLMKKKLIIAISALMTLPATLFGQSYDKLWKQVTEAQDKDLPQQVIDGDGYHRRCGSRLAELRADTS